MYRLRGLMMMMYTVCKSLSNNYSLTTLTFNQIKF